MSEEQKNEIIAFLKENLKLSIMEDRCYYSSDRCITFSIVINNETISSQDIYIQ